MAGHPDCVHGNIIHAYFVPHLYVDRHAYHSCNPPLLWKNRVNGSWLRHFFILSVFYHGQYYRFWGRYEPDYGNELEIRFPNHDCHHTGLLFYQRRIFQGGKADYTVYPGYDCMFLCNAGSHRRAGLGRDGFRASPLEGCGRKPYNVTCLCEYQCGNHGRHLRHLSWGGEEMEKRRFI